MDVLGKVFIVPEDVSWFQFVLLSFKLAHKFLFLQCFNFQWGDWFGFGFCFLVFWVIFPGEKGLYTSKLEMKTFSISLKTENTRCDIPFFKLDILGKWTSSPTPSLLKIVTFV